MCCEHTDKPEPLTREMIEALSAQRARREVLLRRHYAAEWVGQDTLPGFSVVFSTNGTIEQPTPVAQPAVAKELVLA